ncbi:DUF2065 domain-containing protein [Halovulum sp. GXIMD14794]
MTFADLLTGLGLAAVIEGLVLALAPSRMDDILDLLRSIPVDARRSLGLGVIALGVALVWIANG